MASCIPSAPAWAASRATSSTCARRLSLASRRLVVTLFMSALRFQRTIERLSAIVAHLLVNCALESPLERVGRVRNLGDVKRIAGKNLIKRRSRYAHKHTHFDIKISVYRYLHTNVLNRCRVTHLVGLYFHTNWLYTRLALVVDSLFSDILIEFRYVHDLTTAVHLYFGGHTGLRGAFQGINPLRCE